MTLSLRILLTLITTISFGKALICDVCQGTPENCEKNQQIQDCKNFGADQVCANFFDYSQGEPRVQKRCYQRKACEVQASRDDNFCGEFDGKDKPCRCCCDKRRCNRLKKGCIVPSRCGVPKAKAVGTYSCPRPTERGSVCNFTCPGDFDRYGSPTTRCDLNGATGKLTWSPLNQQCRKVRCRALKAPENGQISCTNFGRYANRPDFIYVKTRCRFSCDKGYKLRGTRNSVCGVRGNWNPGGQKCVPDPCDRFATDPNRIDDCTNGRLLGSKCTFQCKAGYKLVGEQENECVESGTSKVWDKKPPKCVKVKCYPEQKNPVNGLVVCTNDNFENSVCTFTCDDGYDIVETADDTATTTCEDDGNNNDIGKWSDDPITCVRKKCQPRLKRPENGTIDCTDTNNLGSVCTFRCNVGYDLEGTSRSIINSECQEDGDGDHLGQWSREAPKCTRIKCVPPHRNPENGKVSCSDGNNVMSSCKFTCDAGYDLAETEESTYVSDCEDDGDGDINGQWSKPAPTCIIKKCRLIIQPEHSTYKCTRDNLISSTCTFQCDVGWKLEGFSAIVCIDEKQDGDDIAEWSNPEPKCVPDPCDPFSTDENRVDTCTNGNFFGSKCTFRCKKGYKLLGEQELECVELKTSKVWDKTPPSCVKVRCFPEQKNPSNGLVSCTNQNFENSVCTFTCDVGYDIVGTADETATTTCEDDENGDDIGKWSDDPITCVRKKCQPRLRRPQNGTIECTDTNNLGSVCTFRCNEGYDLEGTSTSTLNSICEDDGNGDHLGKWSRKAPKCNLIKCVPPHRNPKNGEVTCSDGNNIMSSCTFICDEGYDLAETKDSAYISDCEDDGDGDVNGQWSKPAPTCVIKKCRSINQPEHSTFKCTRDNLISSTCTFECDFGWELVGDSEIVCVDKNADGDAIVEWSKPESKCSRIFCSKQGHDDTVVANCDPPGNNRLVVDAVCTYQCAEEGYYLVSYDAATVAIQSGKYDVTCLSTADWDIRAPRCNPITCPILPIPENALEPDCSNRNWLNSECEYKCEKTYALTHTEPLTCISDGNDADKRGKWNRAAPECKKNECDEFQHINNGKKTYSNGLNIGTVMSLECFQDYTYKRYEKAECLPADISKGQPVPYWNQTRFVCCVKCEFNSRVRVVAMIDKTAARSPEDWSEISTWIYYTLEYLFVKNYDVKFSTVLYGEDVDESNSMSERKIEYSGMVDDIWLDILDNEHYGGEGSDTAKALKYAEDNIFRRYTATTSSRRPADEPFIFLIKRDGPAISSVAAAKDLITRRVHILAMGFRNREKAETEQRELQKITGDDKKVIMIGNLQDVTQSGIRVTEISRAQGCSRESRTNECT